MNDECKYQECDITKDLTLLVVVYITKVVKVCFNLDNNKMTIIIRIAIYQARQ